MKRQVCMPKEGRELHGKVKRERQRVEVQRIVHVYPCARILSRGGRVSVDTHVCIYRRKRTEASSLQDDGRHGAKEREKER